VVLRAGLDAVTVAGGVEFNEKLPICESNILYPAMAVL
jgi:hypothetical protein